MKKIFYFLVFAILISVNANSQSICAMGNFIIEKDNFTVAKNFLIRNGFSFQTFEELKAFSHNPSTVITGMKGDDPSNSIMASINAISTKDHRIKEVMFICSETGVESDLVKTGYKKIKERKYVEAGRFEVIERTYQRILGNNTNTVVGKFSKSGDEGAQIVFSSKGNAVK